MIPGPVEVSPAVRAAGAAPPTGHLAPGFIEAFGASLERMREVWLAGAASQPFVVPGAGTLAMELAVANVFEPGERALVVNTGFFSDRLVEMLLRYGVAVEEVAAEVGQAPSADRVAQALRRMREAGEVHALLATHVDTSTGVRVDPEPLARLARSEGVLSIFDGVCATAAERFDMAGWGADVYLTASQKAIGIAPGLALVVAGERALAARARRSAAPPPLYLDWESWRPVMQAYEERRPAYFSTPATSLVVALEVGLREILADGMPARFDRHARAARALGQAWQALGLRPVPARAEWTAHTLSALRLPAGTDASLLPRIASRGVVVAGGLHPQIRSEYFRVGHMGYAVTQPQMLRRTVEAIAGALDEAGAPGDARAALAAIDALA
jgi:alanine-glyoxylate transaminase/serine-glyoxylate transaminase/serine-pyruvate transaminase